MSGRVVSFFKRTVPRDWSAQELAEFYRVEAALLQSGLSVSLDRGLTDEGDPWFVFCRAEDDEVIVHFARIDGRYLISAPTFGGNVTGHDFRALVRDMVERHPVLRPAKREENVALHPSALLVMLVASALLKMIHTADAATPTDRPAGAAADPDAAPIRITIGGVEHTADLVSQETQQYVAMLSVIALASGPMDDPSIPMFMVSAVAPEQSPQAHTPLPSHELAADWGSPLGMSGAGSVGPVSPPSAAPVSTVVESTAGHTHDVASWQTPVVPIGGGATPLADLMVAPSAQVPASPSPAVSPTDAPVVSVASPGPIQGNHDLANSLLQILGGNEPIQYSDTLPAAFVAPLHSSVHTLAATLVAEPHDVATTPAVILPLSGLPMSVFVEGGPVPAATSDASISVVAPYGTLFTTVPAIPTPPLPVPGATELSAVLTLMQDFAQAVGPQHLAVLDVGNQVIEYDYYAEAHTPAALIAVTYDFADGSHISLVGLKNELPHATI